MRGAVLAGCVLMLAGCATDEPAADAAPDAAVAEVVGRIARQYLAESQIVGLSVTIARDGRLVHDAGYGLARRSPDVAAGATIQFEMFSVGKSATAVLLLALEARGLVDLDATAGSYVHDLPAPYASATLRQLLHHSAGIAEVEIDEFHPEARFLRTPTRGDLLAWLAEGQAVAHPNETWLYNNQGFFVAGLVAEEVTGQRYGELLRSVIAGPLGLRSFAYCPDLAGTRAQGYMFVDATVQPIPPIDNGWFGGAGSVCATTGDFARWWLAVRGGRLLAPAALQAWLTPVTLDRDGVQASFGYGLAVRLGVYGGHTVIGHTGDGAGGTAVLAEYPDDRLLIVVASNTAGSGVPYAIEIQAAIARDLLNMPEATRTTVEIAPEALTTVPGLYRSSEGAFCVQADGDLLLVSTDEQQSVELNHIGAGRFVRPGNTDIVEYFLGWPDHTEWFGYDWHGLPMDLATRTSDGCD